MTSLLGQRGYFSNHQNRFTPIQQQRTNPVPGTGPFLVQPPNPIPASRSIAQPVVLPLKQPDPPVSPVQELFASPQKSISKIPAESSNLWQEQVGVLIKQYGPSLMKQFGPQLARKVGYPLAQRFGPPLVSKVGIPLVQRIGTPLARKLVLPLVKRAGFALIRHLGFPF